MSRLSKESPEATPEAEFRRILAEVRRAEALQEGRPRQEGELATPAPSLSIEALFSLDDVQARAPGGASHWAAAMAFLEEVLAKSEICRRKCVGVVGSRSSATCFLGRKYELAAIAFRDPVADCIDI